MSGSLAVASRLKLDSIALPAISTGIFGEVAKIVNPKSVVCDVQGFGYACRDKEIKKLRYSLLRPEIDRYLWLGRKTSLAVESVLSVAKPGMRECMVTGEVLRVLWYDRIDSICNQSAADDRSRKYRHAIATERPVDKYLMLNVNARKWGLVTTIHADRVLRQGRQGPRQAVRRQRVYRVRHDRGLQAGDRDVGDLQEDRRLVCRTGISRGVEAPSSGRRAMVPEPGLHHLSHLERDHPGQPVPVLEPDHSGQEVRNEIRRRFHRYGTGTDHDHRTGCVSDSEDGGRGHELHTTKPKPYHGLRIFRNNGNLAFTEAYFYPMHGALRAVVEDFDADGDPDAAVIAMWADWKFEEPETFVYLENRGGLQFSPESVPTEQFGIWVSIDAGDVNADNKPDIILGLGNWPELAPAEWTTRPVMKGRNGTAPSITFLINTYP